MTNSTITPVGSTQQKTNVLQWLNELFLVYLLICAVSMISGGFKLAAGEHAQELFSFARNPFAGLMVGIIATALIQSSSTVTSVIVGLVAGGLPIELAVPMIMGANVGTSVTNTIVSLGHVQDKSEFRRAFAAATVHDFFNLFAVIIFLPLEIIFGIFEKFSELLVRLFFATSEIAIQDINFVKSATKPVINIANTFVQNFAEPIGGLLLIAIGIFLIFFSITYIAKLLRHLMVGRARNIMHASIGRAPISSMFSGAVVTILVQSSSTTTSLMVPLAGSNTFTLKQIYPFTLGANIGTCITALLAATAVTGNTQAALQIAFIHLSYNILGVLVIYGLPFLRNIPVRAAEQLGTTGADNKLIALAYILGLFFILPGVCLVLSNTF